MKKLISIAIVVASLPLAAAAWPGQGYVPTPTPAHHDHERWSTLSWSSPASKGREVIRLSGKDRDIDRLRLESVRGATRFREVIVEYADRTTERTPLELTLHAGQDHVIALRDREVTRITVVTDRQSNGTYSVYAED